MNKVELHQTVLGKAAWTKFAKKLEKAMIEEYHLDGVTVLLRELSKAEIANEESDLLTFKHESQRFEYALGPTERFPAAWKVADRIDHFLNPDPDETS